VYKIRYVINQYHALYKLRAIAVPLIIPMMGKTPIISHHGKYLDLALNDLGSLGDLLEEFQIYWKSESV
jgi:hypothetical protein